MNRLLIILICVLSAMTSQAAKEKWVDPYKDYDETRFMDMDFDQNILTPKVGKAEHQAVSRHMTRLGINLANKGYTVDKMRNDEVLVVTIPTDQLFLPNDTLILSSSVGKLAGITSLLRDPDMFKVVYAVHTDNTGSPIYNMELSHWRNNSIYDWFLTNVSEDQIVIPFEMGDTDPVEKNNSRLGRMANRRLEIYLIPGPKMITQAHKGLLK